MIFFIHGSGDLNPLDFISFPFDFLSTRGNDLKIGVEQLYDDSRCHVYFGNMAQSKIVPQQIDQITESPNSVVAIFSIYDFKG